jgi:hypothetical protein
MPDTEAEKSWEDERLIETWNTRAPDHSALLKQITGVLEEAKQALEFTSYALRDKIDAALAAVRKED